MDEMKVTNGDITLRVEVTGDGPTVLCVPGWPELASSYHHQVEHLAGERVPGRGARRAWLRRQLGSDRGRAVLAAPARRRRRCGGCRARRRADRARRPRLGRADRVEHRDPPSRSCACGRRAERPAHAAVPDISARPARPALRRPLLLHALLRQARCARGRVRGRHARRAEARSTSRCRAMRRSTAGSPRGHATRSSFPCCPIRPTGRSAS